MLQDALLRCTGEVGGLNPTAANCAAEAPFCAGGTPFCAHIASVKDPAREPGAAALPTSSRRRAQISLNVGRVSGFGAQQSRMSFW